MYKKILLIKIIFSALIITSANAEPSASTLYTLQTACTNTSGINSSSNTYQLECVSIGGVAGGEMTSAVYTMKAGYTYVLLHQQSNTPPYILSFTPAEHDSCEAGETLLIEIDARDDDNDPLEYRILIDDSQERDWDSDEYYSWLTEQADSGGHKIKVQVRDDSLQTDENEVNIHVFKRPIYPAQ